MSKDTQNFFFDMSDKDAAMFTKNAGVNGIAIKITRFSNLILLNIDTYFFNFSWSFLFTNLLGS